MHVIDGFNFAGTMFTNTINKLKCFRFVGIIFLWATAATAAAAAAAYCMHAVERQNFMKPQRIYNFLISFHHLPLGSKSTTPSLGLFESTFRICEFVYEYLRCVYISGCQHVHSLRMIHISYK